MMIKMSLDKETVLSHDVSPAFPTTVNLSEQLLLAKTRPLYPKNNLLPSGNSQPSLNTSAPPVQRIAKRRYSMGVGLKGLAKGLAKRRRRVNSDSQSEPVLPSHFMLGGNIFDPLNLNSLLDEDINKVTNQETPKCSPLPSRGGDPVEILFPRDITDPLNLKGGGKDGKGGGILLSPVKSRRRHRNRHHGGGGEKEVLPARLFPPTAGRIGEIPAGGGGERETVPVMPTEGAASESPLPCELNTAITCRDDVAPPPILPRRHTHPPPSGNQRDGRQRRRRRTTSTKSVEPPSTTAPSTKAPSSKFQTPLVGGAKANRCGGQQPASSQPLQKDKNRYQFGNHTRYYGYHGFYGDQWEGRIGKEEDSRLHLLEADWFRHKKVLDIGCGAGHMTLAVARKFDPAHILGVEQDERLVRAANQNIRHFLSHDLVVEERRMKTGAGRQREGLKMKVMEKKEVKEEKMEKELMEEKKNEELIQEFQKALCLLSFPVSFRVSRGPLSAPPLIAQSSPSSRFPGNITFIQGNYVSEWEAWSGLGRYDVIMCLSVTKWVQLQLGDVGVVRLFRRAYQSLSPGGLFILEPQQWSSYSRSKKNSEVMYRHFTTIRLRPEHFTFYLTNSIGFTSYRLLTHTGNQRPIYLFHKGPAHRN